MPAEPRLRITGRSSSHFTRVATLLACELGLDFELDVVHEPLSLDAETFGGHPALKIPVLQVGGERLFGTENICRKLVELAPGEPRVVFPEHVHADVARNAQELVWHAMSAQVQLRIGVTLARLDSENVFFARVRAGLSGALAWLETHLPEVLDALPAPRVVSLFEVTLFCLLEHLAFLPSIPDAPRPRLEGFVARFAERASARRTAFHFDARPTKGAPMKLELPALDPSTVTARTGSSYPEVFQSRVLPREKRALGDALGLTRFGVNLTTLFPGRESSLRHHHSQEDELVFVLTGEVVLVTDGGEQRLSAGMCAGFPAGSGISHHLVNRGDRPARYLEIGNRDPADTVEYLDVDLAVRKDPKGGWLFTRRDGSAY